MKLPNEAQRCFKACRASRLTGQEVLLLLALIVCGLSFNTSAQEAPVGELQTTRTLSCSGTMTNVSVISGGYVATCSSAWGQTDVKWVYNPVTEAQLAVLQAQVDAIESWDSQMDPAAVNDLLTAMLFFFVVLFIAREVYKTFKH